MPNNFVSLADLERQEEEYPSPEAAESATKDAVLLSVYGDFYLAQQRQVCSEGYSTVAFNARQIKRTADNYNRVPRLTTDEVIDRLKCGHHEIYRANSWTLSSPIERLCIKGPHTIANLPNMWTLVEAYNNHA